VRQQFGKLGKVSENWDGNTLHFTVDVSGMSIPGHVAVEMQVVRLEIVLPAAMAMLAGGMKQTIEQEAKKLLERRP
jgi:Putative polyhydroxyalkanoic acid system protein (PHA_gran_rgn)